jgi:hypothetical protein
MLNPSGNGNQWRNIIKLKKMSLVSCGEFRINIFWNVGFSKVSRIGGVGTPKTSMSITLSLFNEP